jgi:hypothetical protein
LTHGHQLNFLFFKEKNLEKLFFQKKKKKKKLGWVWPPTWAPRSHPHGAKGVALGAQWVAETTHWVLKFLAFGVEWFGGFGEIQFVHRVMWRDGIH